MGSPANFRRRRRSYSNCKWQLKYKNTDYIKCLSAPFLVSLLSRTDVSHKDFWWINGGGLCTTKNHLLLYWGLRQQRLQVFIFIEGASQRLLGAKNRNTRALLGTEDAYIFSENRRFPSKMFFRRFTLFRFYRHHNDLIV